MYAIIDIAGKQYKIRESDKIYVSRLDAEVGDELSFDRVLLVSDGGSTKVGLPVVDGATVSATVIEHVKGDKVTVFKKKRRKGYRVKRGHRQPFTQIEISSLSVASRSKSKSTKETKETKESES